MRALIVDDEPLARARLMRLLSEHAHINCVGEATNASEALALVDTLQPDLVLLDIEMPGMDGLTLAKELNQMTIPPAIIMVTAHPEHALEAYRAGPSDYLVKPVDPKRLHEALNRVGSPTRAHLEKQDELNPWISYQVGNHLRRIRFDKVQYFMAEDKVVKMVFDGGEAIVEQSLKELEVAYDHLLMRIHRNTLVNWARIKSITVNSNQQPLLYLENLSAPLSISRRNYSKVKIKLSSIFG